MEERHKEQIKMKICPTGHMTGHHLANGKPQCIATSFYLFSEMFARWGLQLNIKYFLISLFAKNWPPEKLLKLSQQYLAITKFVRSNYKFMVFHFVKHFIPNST